MVTPEEIPGGAKRRRGRRNSFDDVRSSELSGGKRSLSSFDALLRTLRSRELELQGTRSVENTGNQEPESLNGPLNDPPNSAQSSLSRTQDVNAGAHDNENTSHDLLETQENGRQEERGSDSNAVETVPDQSLGHPATSVNTGGSALEAELSELVGSREVDKVFCCKWLDHKDLLVGTKCGRLLRFKPHEEIATQKPTCVETRLPVNANIARSDHESGGIHDLSVNPSNTVLACAGIGLRAETVALYRVHDMKPLTVCSDEDASHKDWVFAVSWINDHTLVSASRDGSLVVRSLPEDMQDLASTGPAVSRSSTLSAQSSSSSETVSMAQHQSQHVPGALVTKSSYLKAHGGFKVRDCKAFFTGGAERSRLVTIAPDAKPDSAVLLWDVAHGSPSVSDHLSKSAMVNSDMQSSRSAILEFSPCLAVHDTDPHIFGFGLRHDIRLFDSRDLNNRACAFMSEDTTNGPIRSFSIRGHYATCGGASGKLFMFDARKPDRPLQFRYTAPASIFTHAWDPFGFSLFIGGGAIISMDNGSFGMLFS
mmetsp:Transcript_22737/g.44627  ORF Transcript_22737/g.44627 Transcript_22737/m.44627 type:complete len:539 (+) Transcript_22737:210-1826(+)